MLSTSVRDRSLLGAKKAYEEWQRASQEAPDIGWYNVSHTEERSEEVVFLGKWLKWSCKLLDIRYLRSYWAALGHYLRYFKGRSKDSLASC